MFSDCFVFISSLISIFYCDEEKKLGTLSLKQEKQRYKDTNISLANKKRVLATSVQKLMRANANNIINNNKKAFTSLIDRVFRSI